tara:strand:- start:2235 stop:2708 length:474 start_codon:yes stop_codon:yes gene_type:complete
MMQVKVKCLLAPTLIVVAIDQLTKSLAVSRLDPDNPVNLVWTLQLNITRNPGASFSMGSNLTPYIASVAILAALGIAYLAWSEINTRILLWYGIVLGGVLGNVIDRIARSGDGFLGGEVVDFIDFQWWPIFNAADMALVIGLPILMFFRYRDENPHV